MKTFSLKQKDITKEWVLIDADGVILGRLASYISTLLRGKHKTTFTPHLDCGDNVVGINAKNIKMTGNKLEQKTLYRHTGYPGGLKETSYKDILNSPHPEKLIKLSVKRMLSNNKISRKQLSNLKIFSGEDHTLEAQKPRLIPFKEFNRKNI